jgi:DNA-directed RNA polymerase subunit RPC12/RpoP
MSEINLDDAKIKYEGEWVSAQDLANKIQEKMQSGEMKFASLAAALEELNKAMENTHTLDVKIVISKDQYKKLQILGGNDDRGAVRKAIMKAIESGAPGAQKEGKTPEPVNKKQTIIKCPGCKSPIKIETDERPTLVECPTCGISGRLTQENKWAKLDA